MREAASLVLGLKLRHFILLSSVVVGVVVVVGVGVGVVVLSPV